MHHQPLAIWESFENAKSSMIEKKNSISPRELNKTLRTRLNKSLLNYFTHVRILVVTLLSLNSLSSESKVLWPIFYSNSHHNLSRLPVYVHWSCWWVKWFEIEKATEKLFREEIFTKRRILREKILIMYFNHLSYWQKAKFRNSEVNYNSRT